MNTKKKIILSSVLTIALCLSLIAGSTFALFTSESSVNIAVTAGKVDVKATIEDITLHSPTSISANGNVIDDTEAASGNTFNNGGTAQLDGNTLTLDRVTPGDSVTATIKLTNNSNVSIQYRTIIKGGEGDNALLNGLKVTFGEGENAQSFTGNTIKSAWTAFDGETKTIQVTIELPATAGNEYQEKSCNLIFTVEAVQGNAQMPDDEWDGSSVEAPEQDETGVYHITNAAEFMALMNSFNDGVVGTWRGAYAEAKIVLDANIDLGGATIERGIPSFFNGQFDGQNHTVSNFTLKRVTGAEDTDTSYADRYTSLFGAIEGGTACVKNLNVEKATIVGKKGVSAIVTAVWNNATVENCHVIDSTMIGIDQVGAVVGYNGIGTVKNCSATDCNIFYSRTSDLNEDLSGDTCGVIGDNDGTATGCTASNTAPEFKAVDYVLTNAAEFQAYITELNNTPQTGAHRYDGKKVVLTNDIDLGGAVITASGEGYMFSGSFDGLGHTVSNYTIKRTDGKYYTGLFSVYMNGASIKNLTVKNGTVISNDGQVGAVVASVNEGATVENCKAYNCIVSGKDQVGSVVGYACDGIVKDCYAEDCTVLYSEGKHQTNQEYPNGNGNGNNRGEVVGFINTIGKKVDNTSNNTYNNVTVGQGTYVANGVSLNAAGEYMISNAQGLVYCATTFTRSDTTINKVFKLAADIDMAGIEWTPWCNEKQYFNGLFDGQGHTIKNLTINDTHTAAGGHAVGFIGRLGENANGEKSIKNVTFDNANVSGHHYVGVAVGYNEFGKVDNVKVTNSKVTATHVEGADSCGDKAGALIGMCGPNAGYIFVTNCSATNCEVKAARHAAQLIGYGYSSTTYGNLSATNVTVSAIANSGCDGNGAGIVSANALVGNGTTTGLVLPN